MEEGKRLSQRLLFPEVVRFPISDAALLEEIQDELANVGFDISPLGGGSFSVMGLPVEVGASDPQILLEEIISTLREGGQSVEDELHHRLALIMARAAAIPVGQELKQEEMESLLSELLSTGEANLAPDGSTIMVLLGQSLIENTFQ